MDLDLRLLAQVRLESRQRYMALVIHFLTIPLYDVMTLVASGSHQPPCSWGLDPTIERQDYGACYKPVAGGRRTKKERGRSLSPPPAASLGPPPLHKTGPAARRTGLFAGKNH